MKRNCWLKSGAVCSLLLFQLVVAAQDSTIWKMLKVDETLSAILPGNVKRTDSAITKEGHHFNVVIYKVQTTNTAFGLMVMRSVLKKGGQYNKDLRSAYLGLELRYPQRRSAKGNGSGSQRYDR